MKRPGAFYGGLFATASATLVLEVADTRVLSVLTWYHLAFLAISLALLGMTAGALYVYLRPERFTAERAPDELARFALRFALSIPLAHLGLLAVRILSDALWEQVKSGELTGFSIGGSARRVPEPDAAAPEPQREAA